MSNVIELKQPSWTVTGEARCQACRHEWTETRTARTQEDDPLIFECPSCGLCKASMINPYLPSNGDTRWECNCGCELFTLREFGAMCINCGVVASYKDITE